MRWGRLQIGPNRTWYFSGRFRKSMNSITSTLASCSPAMSLKLTPRPFLYILSTRTNFALRSFACQVEEEQHNNIYYVTILYYFYVIFFHIISFYVIFFTLYIFLLYIFFHVIFFFQSDFFHYIFVYFILFTLYFFSDTFSSWRHGTEFGGETRQPLSSA